MSVERDGVLELTHFFVEPGTQARGIGRELLARAFPPGRGRHRVIIATGDARALGMYLRAGVGYVTTAADFFRAPEAVEIESDLEFERLVPSPAGVAAVGAVDEAILGHRRDADVDFLLGNRPGWIARRDGAVAGIAFGAVGANSGPIGALDPADTPALLRLVEREAHAAGLAELYFTVPLVNRAAVGELLARGFRIDPFYVNILADEGSMRLDRWVHTGPVFII
jgi:ribosomal protein S18 acetylase RimI-like enzyme